MDSKQPILGPDLAEHLAALHSEGSLDSRGQFTLSVDRALEFFTRALALKPIAHCVKAVQAAIACGAKDVQVSYSRERIRVIHRGGAVELSQALLKLERRPQPSSQAGLRSYLSWALWGAVADGASRVSWAIVEDKVSSLTDWQFCLSHGERGFGEPEGPFEGPDDSRVVWEVLYPPSWSWSHLKDMVRKNWAFNVELSRAFGFAPVPVRLGGRVLNNPDTWRFLEPSTAWGMLSQNAYGVLERSVGAYARISEEGPQLAVYPPFVRDPFGRSSQPYSTSMAAVVCFSQMATFCYPFYYLDDDKGDPVILHGDERLRELLRNRLEPRFLPMTVAPGSLLKRGPQLALVGVRCLVLFCPDSKDQGRLYLVQDGFLHEPLDTGLSRLTIILATQDIPTDANGVRPILGAHLQADVEFLIEKLKPWAVAQRVATTEDGVVWGMRNIEDNLEGLGELLL